MLKKSFVGLGILVVGVFGMMVFCNKSSNPAAPAGNDVTGTWVGADTVYSPGSFAPDSFTCMLKLTSANTYSMLRSHKNYGSSGFNVDSAREAGSWAKTATGDSVILTPHMAADSTADSCFQYDYSLNTWHQCNGSLEAQFCTCGVPTHIKINIAGSSWSNVTIVRYDDPSKSATFTLTKQ